MKTQSNVAIAIILTIITTFSLNAAPYTEGGKMIVRVAQQDREVIDVQLANLQKQRTKVSISDVHGKIWFSEYAWGVHANPKRLDLHGMPAGEYVLLIKNKQQQYVQVFTKTEKGLFFFEKEEPQKGEEATAILTSGSPAAGNVLISRFTADGAHGVDIQLANLLGSKTIVQLKNTDGNTLYEEAIEGQDGYAKKINLEGVVNGHYYFLIRTGKLIRVQFLSIGPRGVELEERQELENESLNGKLALK